MTFDLSNVPWWVTLIVVFVSCIGSYAVARKKAEAGVQKTMLTQTVTRQQQLDERQDKMMDDLDAEIKSLKEEQLILRKEILEERATNRQLTRMVNLISDENKQLKLGMDKLTEENKQLTLGMEKLTEENEQLRIGMRKLTEENEQLRAELGKVEGCK